MRLFRHLREDPAGRRAFIREAIRFWGYFDVLNVKELAEPASLLGGPEIPAGIPLVVSMADALTDPARFPRPAEFRLDRRHAADAFGRGTYRCWFMRWSTEVLLAIIEAAIDMYPDIRLAAEPSLVAEGLSPVPAALIAEGL
jgi:cytochrome P450